jgi:rubrerythrin
MVSTDLTTAAAITPYDYTQHTPDIAERLRKQADRIRQKLRSTVSAIIHIGRDLIAAQEHLQRGQFCTWVERECGFTVRSAQNYMRAAEFAEDKNEIISHLSPTVIYALAAKSTPTEIVNDVVARVEAGEVIAETTIKTMLGEARSERQAAADKAFRDRHRAKTKQRRLEREEQENQAEQERRERRQLEAKAKAVEIIERFGLEEAEFLLRTLGHGGLVLHHLNLEVARRNSDDGGHNSDDAAGGPLGVAPDRPAVEQAGAE